MKTKTRITILNDANEKFFGEGPCRLFHLIDECGSLRAASIEMDMSYSKAFAIVKNAEKSLGFPITVRKIGGKNGGGSELTVKAREWLSRFEEYRDECTRMNEELFTKYFPSFEFGAIVMASGIGKRFGGNKLMANLNEKPLIDSVLCTISGLFQYTLVVTRSQDVKNYTQKKDFHTLLHDYPGRNDAIKVGIKEMPDSVKGCMFFQADQPFIKNKTVCGLVEMASKNPDYIIRCSCNGIPSSPVYFPKWAFKDLCTLPEGKGGSVLFEKYHEKLLDYVVDDCEELKDIDTKEDLLEANKKLF